MVKAVGLFSGGLDSALAIKILQEQGIEVVALNFASAFCTCTGGCSIVKLAESLNVPIKVIKKGMDYLEIVKHPKHGYGKNINPCIDCKIYILKKAKEYADEIGAQFVFTGEVVGQRPMSQHRKTLLLIEEEAGLKGKLVRPLCAGLLEPTEAEINGWVDREKMLSWEGRRRTPQLDLAKQYKMDGFMCGGSGCRLTDHNYAVKLRKLFELKSDATLSDVALLKLGRHFFVNGAWIIVGRDEKENEGLLFAKLPESIVIEALDCSTPTGLFMGKMTDENLELAARLVARYSSAKAEYVDVKCGEKVLSVTKISDDDIAKLLSLS